MNALSPERTAPSYRPVAQEVALFEAAHAKGLPLLLKGPTGCGKTRFVEHMAARLGRPLCTVACHDDLSAADLIGRYLLRGGATEWVDGPLTRAVRDGAICYLDKVIKARKDVTVVLHPLTDNRRTLMIDRTGEELVAPPSFMLVASYNPGYQNILKRLKPSTRQRFLSITFGFPYAATEVAVVARESGLDAATRRQAKREDNDQANRTDSFIMHRFEAIFSWVENTGLNRATDDADLENAQKAAEDQDHITLSKHRKRAATRLRLHLDLAPQDADHERLSDPFTYPEWDHRTHAYLPDHTRVLEAGATPGDTFAPNPRLMARVRQQFQALHPRRILLPRQVDGAELDLDALIAAQVAIRATGQGSDRIFRHLRNAERDLSVAILMDCSRSTESVVGSRSIIDTLRGALAALAGGIDAADDRLAIWGFSSLRRDRVFLTRCKCFDDRVTPEVIARIGGLNPGHYTRLGAAMRHASARLATEPSARKLLLVLTDGKPNDLDHCEGTHGIEDSHMAVREARRLGHAVHGVIVDADGQDWFARIFGRAGFTLLPDPARLGRALPDIYRSLTLEN